MYRYIDDENINVVRGLISGSRAVTTFGYSPGPFPALRTVREPTEPYFFMTVPGTLTISSSSASDSSTGVGAQQVTIEGLDQNWFDSSETVTLNGITPVSTTKQFIRVNSFSISRAGSNQTNSGIINLYQGANFIDRILVNGRNQSVTPIFSVPAGKNGFLTNVSVSAEGSNVVLQHNAVVRFNDGSGRPPRMRFAMAMASKSYNSNLSYPILLPEKSDIDWRVVEITTGSNASATVIFTVLVVNK